MPFDSLTKMKKYLLPPLVAFCLNWSGAAISADFVAVRIEAEDFTSKSDRWVLTSPDHVPDLGPDPDPPHNSNASGKANLELLPDTRVTHNDDVFGGPDGNFWGAPGGGPRIDYDVNVPEAGRYLVYVKTFSTNTEDNGIHVGVNGTKPESGQRIQICSKHNWFWTSGQRTDENHCGVSKTIWLDFPAAGVNTITFFAREDGFEIDQFLLLKETHDGSLDCFPTFTDVIRCRDITTGATVSDTVVPISPTVDDSTVIIPPVVPEPEPQIIEVDLEIDLNAIGTMHFVGDNVEYQVTATNNSQQDTASNATATIDLPDNLNFSTSADCTVIGSEVTCIFGDLSPGTSDTLSFTATAVAVGNHRADAQVTANEDDNNSSNNIDSATVNAQISIPDFEGAISLVQGSNASAIDGINQYTATITNNGQQQISTATLKVTTGSGISALLCDPTCAVPAINPGESTTVSFNTVATQSGTFAVTAALIMPDDANTENNTATLSESVTESNSVVISNDNILTFEAETFNTSSTAVTDNAPRWFVIDDNFVALAEQLDPDNAAHQSVSGSAYVELLPDLRIDENAASISDITNFSDGGIGSTLTYQFFAEAGTYNVYARIRSNNSQDSSLHVGLNNNWPNSGNSLSVCNPDGTWQWTNTIRKGSACDAASNATITVDVAGIHTLMISQGTDGLELDKLILTKDDIAALNGNGPTSITADSTQQADISISTALQNPNVVAGDSTELAVTVGGDSNIDVAGVTLRIDGSHTYQSGEFDSCITGDSATVCSVRELPAGQQVSGSFLIEASESDTTLINSAVNAIQTDINITNNESQQSLTLADEDSEVRKTESSSGGGSLSLWFLLTLILFVATSSTARRQTVLIRK